MHASARQHLHHVKGRQEGGCLPASLACIRLYSTDHILNKGQPLQLSGVLTRGFDYHC
jgi:hypothetical protein